MLTCIHHHPAPHLITMETEMKLELTDLQFRNLAEHIPPEKASELGLSLGLTKTDLSSIIKTNDPVGNTFRVLVCWRTNLDPALIRWRNKVEGRQTEMVKLKTALKEHNLETFIPCIDAHVTVEENEVEAASPIVNLALPNPSHEAGKRQEIDIIATFESADDVTIRTLHTHMYHLVTHPADSDISWSKIRRLKSFFEPHARLINILLVPMNFTVDVVSLDDLRSLKRSIDSGQLAKDLLPVMMSQGGEEGAVQADPAHVVLRLKIDEKSFNNGMQFFKDLDPSAVSLNGSSQDRASSQSDTANGFNAWTARRPKANVDLPDTQERGVKLVWRNVSQPSFGF